MAATPASQPKPGTSEWLRQQRADRETREAAELAAHARGATRKGVARAARKAVARARRAR